MSSIYMLLLISPMLLLSNGYDGNVFVEVASNFPSDLNSYCYIGERIAFNKMACAAQCAFQSNCRLFCLAGSKCRLYSAWVSRHWVGEPSVAASVFRCYTSWGSTHEASGDASISHSGGSRIEKATDGYFCQSEDYCYHSTLQSNPWIYADLGTVRDVISVRIVTRSNTNYDRHMHSMEVRVGNSTTSLSSNQLLAKLTFNPGWREEVTLKGSTPITGSVVSLQRPLSSVYFMICELQIFFV